MNVIRPIADNTVLLLKPKGDCHTNRNHCVLLRSKEEPKCESECATGTFYTACCKSCYHLKFGSSFPILLFGFVLVLRKVSLQVAV